jgi:gamma-glutamyltranspeptidase / glutathione hydrolase
MSDRFEQAFAPYAMVSSAHYLASQAGVWMLRQGGNAVDAAVCSAAAIAVVAPHLNGIGGDLFAQVWVPGSPRPVGLNASGRSSESATVKRFAELGYSEMPARGPLTINVPGAVSGWASLLERFGTRRLVDVLEPALSYAEHGAPVTYKLSKAIQGNLELIQSDPGFSRIFMRDGRPLRQGEVFVNRDLAASLQEIGATDGQAMYRGGLAERLADGIQQRGGLVSNRDLASHRANWVEPLSTTFAGRTLYEMPPNSQGLTALQLFNMAEADSVWTLGHNSPRYIEALVGMMKIAYSDRSSFVTDPDFSDVPIDRLVSKDYARERLRTEMPDPPDSRESDTIYLCAVDDNRLAVSLIQSLYQGFGSGVMAEGTGIALHNRGTFFSLDERHPNSLQPSKRTMHTLIPAFAGIDGNAEIVFGSMGGDAQPQFQLQIMLNHLIFGMDIQAAIEAPRFNYAPDARGAGPKVMLEHRFESNVVGVLRARGFQAEVVEDWSSQMGHAQAIRLGRENGVLSGAADPRGDGAALGY